MMWAIKYYDDWALSKERSTVSVLEKIKPRGWKEGIIARFFELKDQIYMSKLSSRVDILSEGENFNQLCCVSGPLTEPDIGGSSGKRKKFFLCRMRRSCLSYQSVVKLFQEMKEYNLKLEGSSTGHHPALATVSALGDLFPANHSPMQFEALPESITSFEAKVKRFVQADPFVACKVSLLPPARAGGPGGVLSTVLDLCRNFCGEETASRKAQVLSNRPFRFFIPLNY
jgi:hypothetical protein